MFARHFTNFVYDTANKIFSSYLSFRNSISSSLLARREYNFFFILHSLRRRKNIFNEKHVMVLSYTSKTFPLFTDSPFWLTLIITSFAVFSTISFISFLNFVSFALCRRLETRHFSNMEPIVVNTNAPIPASA